MILNYLNEYSFIDVRLDEAYNKSTDIYLLGKESSK
ncbi:hypothetical protein FAEPRAM212_01634 [Faecalibacterium prausnitzii M21/2]|uniref:Uncharacterized protein n=1 Tax=Faecalibacterium prausnitzii M21/2 TaxID=411485 RepID=A8SBD4_9FIRM|nr:hypothetical protein FAEPRAM212_01634 [Faecalibacterium prausnitzii M21/2]